MNSATSVSTANNIHVSLRDGAGSRRSFAGTDGFNPASQ
jgi:hypothetical protein